MLKKIIMTIALLFSSFSFANPTSSSELDEVQFFFGGITDFKCCYLLNKKQRAPFDGFLLEPYQLVFIKDTLDVWQEDLAFQLAQVNSLCDQKISLCQDNRTLLLDELKKEALFYSNLSDDLNTKLIKVKSDYKLFKVITYISIPIAISLGAYVTYKF